MVGPQRFSLAMQAEGQRGTDEDWAIIAAEPSFEAGFARLNLFAYTTGWGRWECVEVDHEARQAVFRVHGGWEGLAAARHRHQLGLRADRRQVHGLRRRGCSGPTAGAARRCSSPTATPTTRSWSRPPIATSTRARRAGAERPGDQRRLAAGAGGAAAHRRGARAGAGRARPQRAGAADKLDIIAQQQAAIQALSTPIIQVWDGVLAVPVIGAVDGERTSRMMEKLLETIIHTKSRHAIIDVTGVETVDTHTADNFVRLIRGVQLLGAQGIISGIGPLVAQTIVDLGVDLTGIPTFANLKEALQACIAPQPSGAASGRGGARS
jgi:rsbT co-antagonist protein RsbR